MTAGTEVPPTLTVTERRHALSELASQYNAEASSNERPLTDALPSLLWLLVAAHLTSDAAIDLFDRFARAQAMSGHAHASYAEIAAAELLAEQLLDQLVGEAMQ